MNVAMKPGGGGGACSAARTRVGVEPGALWGGRAMLWDASTLWMLVPALLFVTAAVVGVVLLAGHVKRRRVPIPAAVFHGVVGGLGLLLLIVGVVRGHEEGQVGSWPVWVMALMLGVAAGGGVLFYFHARGRPIPMGVAALHAGGALVGIVLLGAIILARGQNRTEPAPIVPEEARASAARGD